MRYHLLQNFFEKVVKIKETSFLLAQWSRALSEKKNVTAIFAKYQIFCFAQGSKWAILENFLSSDIWDIVILGFLPFKEIKQFRSKIIIYGTFKVTESKYVTNNFCFHDEFAKSKAVCFLIFPLTSLGRGKTSPYSIKKDYGFPAS